MSTLIEPLNPLDALGNFLKTVEKTAEIIEKTGMNNIKIMFNCYQIQINQGHLPKRFENTFPLSAMSSLLQFMTVENPIQGN